MGARGPEGTRVRRLRPGGPQCSRGAGWGGTREGETRRTSPSTGAPARGSAHARWAHECSYLQGTPDCWVRRSEGHPRDIGTAAPSQQHEGWGNVRADPEEASGGHGQPDHHCTQPGASSASTPAPRGHHRGTDGKHARAQREAHAQEVAGAGQPHPHPCSSEPSCEGGTTQLRTRRGPSLPTSMPLWRASFTAVL